MQHSKAFVFDAHLLRFQLPNLPPNHPIAPRPQQDSPVESPRGFFSGNLDIAGPSRQSIPLAGAVLVEKATTQVLAPELHKFTPNKRFANEAELKRSTVFRFMKETDFNRLGKQTESALQEASFLDVKGKPMLMSAATASQCLEDWGLTAQVSSADSLDPDLYDLYQIGLPNLAKAVAICRELRTQTASLDAQSQAEIRQVLRSLFAHGLTVCIPGVIQNIEEAWNAVANAVDPPNLADEFKRRTAQAAVNVLTKNVYQRFSGQRYFANNQIHMVAALKNALAGRYGLEKTEDKYASAEYATTLLGPDGNRLNAALDEATAPLVLCRALAGDLMQQVLNRLQTEGLAPSERQGDVIHEMAKKITDQYVACSPYTIGQFDIELGVVTQPSNSVAPLAITLLQQGQRQGLFEVVDHQVAIPRPNLPSLNLVFVGDLVCVKDNAGGQTPVMVPLTVEELLPDASSWIQADLDAPDQRADARPLAVTSPGLAAVFEAMQNSKGGVWASAWKSGSEHLTANQAKAFLDVMSVHTPELQGLFGKGDMSGWAQHALLNNVAHRKPELFNLIPTPTMESWLDGLERRLDVDSRRSPIQSTLIGVLYEHQFTQCKPLVEIAIKRGVKVYFPVVSGDKPDSRASTLVVHGLEWVQPMLKLAQADQKAAVLEAMMRATLLELTVSHDKDSMAILDALRQQGACVFTHQASAWEYLLKYSLKKDLPRNNLKNLLSWVAEHAIQQWQPQALSLLFSAIGAGKVDLSVVETYLGQPHRRIDNYSGHSSPSLQQAQHNYGQAVKGLLAGRDPRALELALSLMSHFQAKGFPKVQNEDLMAGLTAAIDRGYTGVISLASRAGQIPQNLTYALVEKLFEATHRVDAILSEMAGHIIPEGFEKSGASHNWDFVTRALARDLPGLAHVVLAKMVGKDNINKLDSQGFAPLHHCVRSGNNKLITPLVAAGADVNIQTSDAHNQKTPLHYARLKKNEQAEKVLLALGANADIADARGRKPGEIGLMRRILNLRR